MLEISFMGQSMEKENKLKINVTFKENFIMEQKYSGNLFILNLYMKEILKTIYLMDLEKLHI
jgi:hypothetical protein